MNKITNKTKILYRSESSKYQQILRQEFGSETLRQNIILTKWIRNPQNYRRNRLGINKPKLKNFDHNCMSYKLKGVSPSNLY